MTTYLRRLLVLGGLAAGCLAFSSEAKAQFPVVVAPSQTVVTQTVVPGTVVGFTAERAGLFGWRTVYRPIVAPINTAVPMTTVVPVASSVTVARPVISQPVVMGFAPQTSSAPVTSFFAPTMSSTVITSPMVSSPVVSSQMFGAPVSSVQTMGVPSMAPVTTFRFPIETNLVVPSSGF